MKRRRIQRKLSQTAGRRAGAAGSRGAIGPGTRLGVAALAAGSFAIVQVPVHAAGLPTPCPGTSASCSGMKFDKLGTGSTLTSGANQLTINQATAAAIFNWSSFNITAGNTVKFVQPSTSSVALNRIYDPKLSTIDGMLQANGQVYLVNPNGIVFGPHATVDVGGLIASSLNVKDSRITSGLLSDPNLANPVFTSDPAIVGADLAASAGATPSIVVQPGAVLYAAGRNQSGTVVSAGRVFLFAPTVENGGSIRVDGGGQVLLAAGSNIFLGSSADPSLRGLLVEVNGAAGQVGIDAGGNILASRGNITLMGMAVNQSGTLTATSALDDNGSIRLVARSVNNTITSTTVLPTDPSVLLPVAQTGTVSIGSGSHTEVQLDPADTATAPLNDPTAAALRSTIDVEAHSVDIGGTGAAGSTVLRANGGDITVTARQASSTLVLRQPGATGAFDTLTYAVGDGSLLGANDPTATINVGSNTLVDVSGLQHVAVDGARNFVTIDRLTSNNLANAPLQRTGFLLGQSVYLNLASAPSWLNVSNLQAAVAGTQAERNATAGNIALRAEGSVNLAPGSVLNVSGGSIDYTSAVGRTSTLISASGAETDISNASADVRYVGFADHGSATYSDTREGINTTLTWQVPHYTQVGGYTAGTNAGRVQIYAPQATLGGTIQAQTVTAVQQRNAPPLGGLLQVGSSNPAQLDAEAGISRASIVAGDPAALAQGLAPGLAAAAGPSAILIDTSMLKKGGVSRLDLTSDGAIEIAAGNALDLGPGGQLTARANAIAVDASVHAAGGSVSLSERPATALKDGISDSSAEYLQRDTLSRIAASSPLRGSVSFAPGVSVSVAGLWTNDLAGTPGTNPTAPLRLNGGSIAVTGRSVDVSGASFDVSAGATVSTSGAFSSGSGGSLSLAGVFRPLNAEVPGADDTGRLVLGAGFASRVAGFGGSKGGSLSLAAPSIDVGGSAGVPALPGTAAAVVVDTALGQRGFQSFNLGAYDVAAVADGVAFSPQVRTIQNNGALSLAPSSASVLSVLAPLAPPPGQLIGSQVSLSAANPLAGVVSVGQGSAIGAGAGGSITLKGGAQVLVDGTLSAPAGRIALSLAPRAADGALTVPSLQGRSLQLGPQALLDVSGLANTLVDVRGLAVGSVLDAGGVTLDAPLGTVAADPGSRVLARGASATIDILQQGAQYRLQDIASAGGTIEVSAGTGLYLEGTIDTHGGSAAVAGGSLSVALQAPSNAAFTSTDFVPAATAVQLAQPLSLDIGAPGPALADRQAAFTTPAGQGVVSAALVDASGFDRVWLQSADRIRFDQSTALSTRGTLALASQSIDAAPGAAVMLAAPYVAVGALQSLSSATSGQSVNAVPAPTTGTGSLAVKAGQVDLAGNFALTGIGQADVVSTGDVRAIGVANAGGLRATGALNFAGDLSIAAAQLYPSTQTDFTFRYTASPAGTGTGGAAPGQVTVSGPAAGSAPALDPLSAGGSLNFNVADLTVSGRVSAPLGTIQVNASDAVRLLPGATLSVAGSGLVPYGSVSNGTTWTYTTGGTTSATTVPVLASPAGATVEPKSIVLNAPNVVAQPGSRLSLGGGGDVLGTGFVAGPGGSYDMSLNFPYATTGSQGARNAFFALVPSRGTAVAAYDAQIYSDLVLDPALPSASAPAFAFGQTLTIGGGSAIPAGTYTILPARYALLPGAFAVESAAGYLDMSPGTTVAMPDGTAIVAGRLGMAAAGTSAARWSGFRVYSDTQFRTLSEFHDYLGSSFFAGADAAANLAAARLGPDAGSLQVGAASTLELGATIDAAPLAGGRGTEVAIDAPAIQVVDGPGGSAAALQLDGAPSSTVRLSAQALGGLKAETLVLGATEQRSAAGSGTVLALANPAQSVSVQSTSPLTAGEVILSASTVDVAAGASVASDASRVPTTRAIFAGSAAQPADGALLYVGSGAVPPSFGRVAASAPGAATTGTLAVGSGASISGRSVIFDATAAQAYAPDLKLAAGNIDLSASLVNLGDVPSGTAGLDLSQALLAQMGSASSLTVTGFGGFDVYGSATIGTLGAGGAPSLNRLTLVGPGLSGMGSSTDQVTVNAGHLTLDNSAGRSVAVAGSGRGALALNASAAGSGDGSIDVAGNFAIGGFNSAALVATGRANGAGTVAGTGDIVFEGAPAAASGLSVAGAGTTLALDSTRITAQRGVNATVTVPGALTIGSTGAAAAAPQATELGASLSVQAQNVDVSGRIDLPAGVVTIATTGTAATDGIALDAGSLVRVAGLTQAFGSTRADVSAGAISLGSASGSVTQAAGATLDLQGAGLRGDAGSLNVSAPTASVSLQGTLLTAPGSAARGADIALDGGTLAGVSTLLQAVNSGSAGARADSVSLRARNGDLLLAPGDSIHARSITLEADGAGGINDGSVQVAGTLDASGVSGGSIAVYANDQVLLQPGARVLAYSTGSGAGGGSVMLSARVTADQAARTSGYGIVLAQDPATGATPVIDVSARGSADPKAGGTITLRSRALGGNDVDVAAIPQGALLGARQDIVEGVVVQQVTGNATLDAATWQANTSAQLAAYMSPANRAAMAARLGLAADPAFSLRPGIEVQATGDILLSDYIDFSSGLADPVSGIGTFTWRYGGGTLPTASNSTLATTDPGALTLRAGGNLVLQETLSDGVMWTVAGDPVNGTVWSSGESWRYTLTAGADLSSANPNRTGAAAADLVVQTSPATGNNDGATWIRTGTGPIALNASRDVLLNNGATPDLQGNVVYTVGVADAAGLPAFPTLWTTQLNSSGYAVTVPVTPQFGRNGGGISISAGRDVLGASAAGQSANPQLVDEWLLRGGQGTAAAPATWWTYDNTFQQGFGTLGGGDLSIAAGRDIVDVGAAAAGSGYDAGAGLAQFKGGDLQVSAGRAIQSGVFFAQDGALGLRATTITSKVPGYSGAGFLRLAQGDNRVDVQTREDALVDAPFNPTAFAPAVINYVPNGSDAVYPYQTMFFTYGSSSEFDVRSAAGDVHLGGGGYSDLALVSGGAASNVSLAAPTVDLVAFGGQVSGASSAQALRLFPAANGQLRVLADGSISQLQLLMSQADPTSPALPQVTAPLDSSAIVFTNLPSSSSTPLHAADPTTAEVVARTGSISQTILDLPKTSEILAAGNIGPLVSIDVQNSNAASLTRIAAGHQINFDDGSGVDHIFIGGPGAALVESGGSMNLGTDGLGIDSRGNLDNRALPPAGASLVVAAGAGRDASGMAAQPNFAGAIAAFVRYDAFAASGASSASLDAQVIAQLEKEPALAPLVAALKSGLADRASAADPASAFSRAIAALSPSQLATGAVKLSSAVQVVANSQFVASQNQDTFAPAYATFGDLFPQLANDAAAIRQFVRANPFEKADNADALRAQALQGLPPALAAAIQLGLGAPASASNPASAFSTALAAIDPATLAGGARQLLSNVLTVAGASRDTLAAAGRLTNGGSPYAKELTALAAAFSPTTTAGLNDLLMDYNEIKAEQSGMVSVLTPQGGVIVGQSSAPTLDTLAARKTAAELGLFTYGGGDIIGMARDNFDVYRSRVFTVAGGDINLWSSLGNIDAGRGARDVSVAAPPRLVTDPNTGLQYLDFGASVSGSGIGALKTDPNQAPSNIALMAPAGYIDAGEAGIRAETGTVTLGTTLVLNAGNINAASGVSGGAVVAAPAPPVPTSSNNNAGDRAVGQAQRDALGQQQAAEERAAAQRRMRVIGEFLSYGDDCETESMAKDSKEGGDDSKDRQAAGKRDSGKCTARPDSAQSPDGDRRESRDSGRH